MKQKKQSTTEKGNEFEDRVFNFLEKEKDEDKFLYGKDNVRIRQKVKFVECLEGRDHTIKELQAELEKSNYENKILAYKLGTLAEHPGEAPKKSDLPTMSVREFDIAIEVYDKINKDKLVHLIVIECANHKKTNINKPESGIGKIQSYTMLDDNGNKTKLDIPINKIILWFALKEAGKSVRNRCKKEGTRLFVEKEGNITQEIYKEQRPYYKNQREISAELSHISNIIKQWELKYMNGNIQYSMATNSFSEKLADSLSNFLKGDTKIKGLKRLGKKYLEKEAISFISNVPQFRKTIFYSEKISIHNICEYIGQQGVKFIFQPIKNKEKQIIASYDTKDKTIRVDNTLPKPQFNFALAHEIAHYKLHQNVQITQYSYDSLDLSQFDKETDKYALKNDKDFMEWQANYFAACLLMPSHIIEYQFNLAKSEIGVLKKDKLVLDKQPCNLRDISYIKQKLARYFEVSPTSVLYRLESLGLLEIKF